MTFEEYQKYGQAHHLELVDAIQNILGHALKQHGLIAHGITGRAKDFDSLRKKLCARGIGVDQPMDDIKDLAGCRIVFLTDSQVDAFNSTRALHENFEVLSVNVHHPVPGTDTETQLFDSTNYLVQMKPDRLALPEYREFDGLRAEIQIQTLLNHAWAEMGHDTIYKKPKLTHLGVKRMTEIGERLHKVMQNHLVPAGYDFDKIATEFQDLLDADKAAGPTIEAIERADNNNDLDSALKTYTDLVLRHFDNPDEEFSARLDALIGAVERSRTNASEPVVTEFGELEGSTSNDIARRVATLLKSYRYYEPDRTLHALVHLYTGACCERERDLWVEVGEELAKHNLDVWNCHGPWVQQVILDQLEGLEADTITHAKALLVTMLSQDLSADVKGITGSSDSVTIRRGTVQASDDLQQIRSHAIDRLEEWLEVAKTDTERLMILEALRRASEMPMNSSGDPGLYLMILKDAARIAEIIFAHASTWGLELRRSHEVQALHLHYRFKILPPDLAENTELIAAHKKLIGAVLDLRDQLAAFDDYVLYKTLIGYDSSQPDAWDGDHFDHRARDAWRQERYPIFLDEVTDETLPEWKSRIDIYVESAGHDPGHYRPLCEFLRLLSEQKPEIALRLLDKVEDHFSRFVPVILSGLDIAERSGDVMNLVDGWIGSGHLLRAVGDYFKKKPQGDVSRLQAYLAKAVDQEDLSSVVQAATIAAAWYEKTADPALIESVMMPVVQFVTEHKHPYWIDQFYAPGEALIVKDMGAPDAKALLQSFVEIYSVSHRTEELLAAVGLQHPKLVIDFFGDRIRRDNTETVGRFDAIPYSIHDLETVLASHPELLLQAVRRWYDENPQLHRFQGGKLFKEVFPKLTKEVADQLGSLARQGSRTDFDFIFRTLSEYEGEKQVYPILMEVVNRLEERDDLLKQVSHVLNETGVVSGEFGFVAASNQRRDLIEPYCDDKRPRVQKYAYDRTRELTQKMAWEQRSATRDIAQRRRDWNEE